MSGHINILWLLLFLCFLSLQGLKSGPYLIKIAIDSNFTPQKPEGFIYIAVLFGAVLVGEFIFRFIQQYLTEYLGQKIMYDMRMDIFKHIQKMEMSFFDKNPVGRVLNQGHNRCAGLK